MNKLPFVELVDEFECHFCFDINTNSVIQIPDDEIEITKEYCNTGNEQLLQQAPMLCKYVQNGFFSCFHPSEIRHPKTDFIKSYLGGVTEKICLQLTQNCNFKCRYCGFASDNKLNRDASNEKMSIDIAKKAIDFLVSLCKGKDILNVGFYGGEPFLCLDIIENCISYCEKKYPMKTWTFSATTNGSICNDRVVELIDKHNFAVTISLDGPKSLHDKNRRWIYNGEGTFDKVYENYQYIKSHVKDTNKISINSVLDQEENYEEYISFFESHVFDGVKRRQGVIDDIRLARNINESEAYRNSVNKGMLKNYIRLYLYGEHINSYDDADIKDFMELCESFSVRSGLDKIEHHNGPCLPGGERLFVSSSGILYPCEKCSENAEILRIGNIYDGFDYDRIEYLLNIGKLTEEECKHCFAIRHCTCCAQKIDNGDSLSRELKLHLCEIEKRRAKEKIRQYIFYKYFLLQDTDERGR